MGLLSNISDKFSIDIRKAPSTEKEIDSLLEFSTIFVPNEYIDIIREASELEINVSRQMYIRIWGAIGCIELNEAYDIQRYIPNSLAIGDDEGGQALIYLNGKKGFGVYIISFGNLDIEDAIFIAPTIADFLQNNIGIEKILSFN